MDNIRPSDVAAERVVLAGIFRYGYDAYIDVADMVNDASFTDRVNQALFKCCRQAFEVGELKTVDEASLYSYAEELGCAWIFEKVDDLRHVRSIFNTNVSLENVAKFGARISKLQITRLLQQQLKDANIQLGDIQGDESINHILGIAENAVFDLSEMLSGKSNNPVSLAEGLDEYLDHLESNPVDMVGIPTGYPKYDEVIGGGWQRGTVNLIGARTNVGKSMLANCIGLNIAASGIPVLYLDTEMTTDKHWNRCLANLSDQSVTINEIKTGQYSRSDFKKTKVREAAEKLKAEPYHYLNISGRPFEETLSIMRRWLIREVGVDGNGKANDCVIIYDYLKLMAGTDINNNLAEYQILGFMTTALHNFAVRYDVPVGAFVQLNRDGIDKETTNVVAGSDRILWLVSTFGLFKYKSPDEISADGPENGNRKMVPLKIRDGEGLPDGDYINMNMIGKFGKVVELDTRGNLEQQETANTNIVDADDASDIPFTELTDDTE